MKTVQFKIRNRDAIFIYIDGEDNKTYVCGFLNDNINTTKTDLEVLEDLKRIDKLKYQKTNLKNTLEDEKKEREIDTEITDMLSEYTACYLDPIAWGFFDTKVWMDSRSRLYLEESNYLDEQITIVMALSKFYEHIQLEYKMDFN